MTFSKNDRQFIEICMIFLLKVNINFFHFINMKVQRKKYIFFLQLKNNDAKRPLFLHHRKEERIDFVIWNEWSLQLIRTGISIMIIT